MPRWTCRPYPSFLPASTLYSHAHCRIEFTVKMPRTNDGWIHLHAVYGSSPWLPDHVPLDTLRKLWTWPPAPNHLCTRRGFILYDARWWRNVCIATARIVWYCRKHNISTTNMYLDRMLMVAVDLLDMYQEGINGNDHISKSYQKGIIGKDHISKSQEWYILRNKLRERIWISMS